MSECPSYDGIYDGNGPCWTCQGRPGECPASAARLLELISEFGDAREDTSGRSDDRQRALWAAIKSIVEVEP